MCIYIYTTTEVEPLLNHGDETHKVATSGFWEHIPILPHCNIHSLSHPVDSIGAS